MGFLDSIFGGDATSEQTMTATFPGYVEKGLKESASAVRAAGKAPFTPFTGQRFAEFSDDEAQAQLGIRDLQQRFDPYISSGLDALGAQQQWGMQGPDANLVQGYMNPFIQNVIDTQTAESNRQQDFAQRDLDSQYGQTSSFQNPAAYAFASGNLADQHRRRQEEMNAQLYMQGYDRALGGAERGLQAAASPANLQGLQGVDLQRLGALNISGQQQRGLEQQGLDFGYDEFRREESYPRDAASFMTQNMGTLGSLTKGGMQTGSQDDGTGWLQKGIGLATGLAGLGAFGSLGGSSIPASSFGITSGNSIAPGGFDTFNTGGALKVHGYNDGSVPFYSGQREWAPPSSDSINFAPIPRQSTLADLAGGEIQGGGLSEGLAQFSEALADGEPPTFQIDDEKKSIEDYEAEAETNQSIIQRLIGYLGNATDGLSQMGYQGPDLPYPAASRGYNKNEGGVLEYAQGGIAGTLGQEIEQLTGMQEQAMQISQELGGDQGGGGLAGLGGGGMGAPRAGSQPPNFMGNAGMGHEAPEYDPFQNYNDRAPFGRGGGQRYRGGRFGRHPGWSGMLAGGIGSIGNSDIPMRTVPSFEGPGGIPGANAGLGATTTGPNTVLNPLQGDNQQRPRPGRGGGGLSNPGLMKPSGASMNGSPMAPQQQQSGSIGNLMGGYPPSPNGPMSSAAQAWLGQPRGFLKGGGVDFGNDIYGGESVGALYGGAGEDDTVDNFLSYQIGANPTNTSAGGGGSEVPVEKKPRLLQDFKEKDYEKFGFYSSVLEDIETGLKNFGLGFGKGLNWLIESPLKLGTKKVSPQDLKDLEEQKKKDPEGYQKWMDQQPEEFQKAVGAAIVKEVEKKQVDKKKTDTDKPKTNEELARDLFGFGPAQKGVDPDIRKAIGNARQTQQDRLLAEEKFNRAKSLQGFKDRTLRHQDLTPSIPQLSLREQATKTVGDRFKQSKRDEGINREALLSFGAAITSTPGGFFKAFPQAAKAYNDAKLAQDARGFEKKKSMLELEQAEMSKLTNQQLANVQQSGELRNIGKYPYEIDALEAKTALDLAKAITEKSGGSGGFGVKKWDPTQLAEQIRADKRYNISPEAAMFAARQHILRVESGQMPRGIGGGNFTGAGGFDDFSIERIKG